MDNPSSEDAKLIAEANKALFGCENPSPTTTQDEQSKPTLENDGAMLKPPPLPPSPQQEQQQQQQPEYPIHNDIVDSEPNPSDLSETEDIEDYPTLNESYAANDMESNMALGGGGGLKRKRKRVMDDPSENNNNNSNNNNNVNELKKLKSMELIVDPDELDKESDNLLTILDQSVSQLAAFEQRSRRNSKDDLKCDDEVLNDDEIDENFNISEKLREMGEISVKPVKSKLAGGSGSSSSGPSSGGGLDESIDDFKTNSNSNDESDDKRKITNLRKNIREVMDDNQLDASTLAAQRQELERLARVQEQQKIIREVQRQIALERQNNKTQTRVMSLLQGHTSLLKNSNAGGPSATTISAIGGSSKVTLPGTSTSVLTKLSSTDLKSRGIKFSDNLRQFKTNLTPSVSIAPVKGPFMRKDTTSYKIDVDDDDEDDDDDDIMSHPLSPGDDDDEEDEDDDDVEPIQDDDDIQSKKDVVTIVDSSDDDCIVLSDDEEIEEEDDDPQNSGLHVNDAYNVADEKGNVVINIGHPESETSIFVAPQIARIIKPHQIGGVRFLFDNVIESIDRYDSSTGFGCILAHSMGLGKTLQLVCFCDIFLRHTSSKTVLCIMPINTLQNWLAEFNMWLPEDAEKSPLRAHGEVRARNFKLFVLNDSHKTLNARSKVVLEWAKEGGVLLIGYEMYRLLSLKKMTKKKKKGKKCDAEKEAEQTDEQKQVWDDIHTALVKPGPDLVICDEGHRIKNSHASISVALKQIRSKRRIVLTGYPLQNNLQEYWCMVDFVRPNYLGTKSEFSNMFERPIQNGQCIDSTPQDIKLMRYRAHVLHSLLLGFVQRRSHAVLQTSLPQKNEYVLLVRMTTFQRKLYDVFMNEVVRKKAVPNPLKAFAVCCKIWNHPDVLYNFLKKREADLDLELEEGEVVAGAAAAGKSPAGKGKNKSSPKKAAGRKSKIFDSAEKNNKPAATISPSTGLANVKSEVIPKQEIKIEKMDESQNVTPKIENLNSSSELIKHEPKTDVNMNNSNASDTSMSSSPYPSSNYSSGYGSQGSYDSYNPYSTPQHNMYSNDPYGNYGSGMSTPNNSQNNYNYGNYGYNQNDYWQNQNYYNQNYNQNYNQHYDNSYYQPNYNDQRYSSYPSNPNENNWNQNQQQMHPPAQQQQQQQAQSQQQQQQQNLSQKLPPSNQMPESKSQEIVDLDTKEIKLEVVRKEEEPLSAKPEEVETSIKTPVNKSEDAATNEEVSNLKLDEIKPDEPDKDLLTKLITSPTKDDGIPYDWAVELMKGYVPDLMENAPKMEIFFCILDESIRLGDRMLVFSQSLLTLNLIEKFLQVQKIPGTESCWAKNVNYYRLDGSTPAIEREKLINEFNSNPNIHLFLVSTRAGSLGINLVGANRVIVFDASWNPCHDTQAVCRVYRYGQKKPCFVYRLVMDNCLEKRIYDRQVNKQGMSDRVVDECNPDAHLSLKEVTNLCWDDEEETEIKDFNDSKEKYIDIVMQKVIESHSRGLSKEPFQHESLLVDRKEKKLSSAEKRLAQRGYELEKQAATRPSYIYNPNLSTSYRAIRTQDGSIVHRPVASVRPMQADLNSDKNNANARPGGARPTRWIPAEVWQRQGMSAQEMTLPLDVVIPTSSAEKANIVLKAGQKVMVLKSPKGIYMQLETGKIIAIRTAFKMGQANKDKMTPPKPSVTLTKNNVNIPANLKNNTSITVVPAKSNAQGRTSVMQNIMKNRNLGNKNVQLGTARPYNMKQNTKSPFSSFLGTGRSTGKDGDDNTNSSDKLYDVEVNDLSKDDDDDDLTNICDDDIEELKSDDDDEEIEKNIKNDSDLKIDEIEPVVEKKEPLIVEPEPPAVTSAVEEIPNPVVPESINSGQQTASNITCNNSNSNTNNSNSNSGENTSNNSNSNNNGSNGGNNNNNNYSNNGNNNNSTPNNNGGNGGNNSNNGGGNNNNNNNNNNPNNNNNNNNNNSSNGSDNNNGNNNSNNENSENSNENTNSTQNNGATAPNEMKTNMQLENDDVIMVSSSQNFPPKAIDSYSIPSCYGMTYGNYPPYYHQSYSYMNPHMQQQQQYYNYPMQSGMHPQYHGQMSNMPGNPYMANHMHHNPHAKSYHHSAPSNMMNANTHAESNHMNAHNMQMNSSSNNQYSNSGGNSQQSNPNTMSQNSGGNASSNIQNSTQNSSNHSSMSTPSKTGSSSSNSNYGHFPHNPQSNNPPNTTASAVIAPPSVTQSAYSTPVTQSYTTSSTTTTTTSQTTSAPFLSNMSSHIPPINHHSSLIPPPSSDISSFPPMPSTNNVISNIQSLQPPISSQSSANMSSMPGNIFPSYTTANISSAGSTTTSQQPANTAMAPMPSQYGSGVNQSPVPNSSSSLYSHPTSNSTNTLPHYSTSKSNASQMSTSSSSIPSNTPTTMSSGSNIPPAHPPNSSSNMSSGPPYSAASSNLSSNPMAFPSQSIPPYSGSNMSLIPPPSFANLPQNTPSNFPGFQSHSNQTTMPSQSTTPTSSASYASSQFPSFPPHSSSYLSSLQFPPHTSALNSPHSFSPLSHPFGGYSQSSSVSSTPPSNYGQSGMQQQSAHMQYPYHSQSSQTPPSSHNQITHSVTSMTNQLTPSTSSTTPTTSSHSFSNQIPHSGSSPQMHHQQQHQQSQYNSSVTTPSQTQTKPIVSASVSTPIMIDDDMEPAPIREKMSYKQNMLERKGSRNQNDMIDPYMQHQHQPHPNMYHEMYSTQKTSKNSLKNYRHNKMSARQMPPVNDGGHESPHNPNQNVNSPGNPMNSNYSIPSNQIPPSQQSSGMSSIPTSVSPHNLNYQQNMYPMYDAMPPQNRHQQSKSYHTPSPHSYQSSLSSPSPMGGPVGPTVGGGGGGGSGGGQQPPKIESSLSFLEKTASAINDDKNGFQASLSNITRSYSPSPNPNYNEMMPSKASPAATTAMKPKRQNKTTKKEKAKLKAAMMTNIEPPQKPKTPNMQNIPTGPYSGGMVPGGGGGGGGSGPPTGPPFMNTSESLFAQNIPTTLAGPLFPSSFAYGGYNTVPSSIPPPIINEQMNQSIPTTTSGQHFSSPYGGYLPQYASTTMPSNSSTAQSPNITAPTTMSSGSVTTTSSSTPNTSIASSVAGGGGGGYSSNSNIPTTSSSSMSNLIPTNTTTSNYDQSIPSPQVSGSAFHRPDVSAYASPYLPPGSGGGPDAMSPSVPSYVGGPPSGPYSSSGNGYGSSSAIPPPIPYQPGGYSSQFPQNLPPPVSTTPTYPPYGYSPGPYGVAAQYGGPPPAAYPPLGSSGMPSYDPQRISSVPNSEQYPAYTPSYSSFPPYAPQSGQWQ